MRYHLLFLALLAFTSIISCDRRHSIRGEGSVVSETRTLPSYGSIQVNGDVDVDIIAANRNEVIVSGYQNLVPVYHTNVTNGTLHLEFDRKYWHVRRNNIRVTIFTQGFRSVSLNGSGDIVIGKHITTNELETTINGSSNIAPDTGGDETVRAKINGLVDVRRAVAAQAYAEISVSGDIDLWATNYSYAGISGSGLIDYRGNPARVDTKVAGSGIERRQYRSPFIYPDLF